MKKKHEDQEMGAGRVPKKKKNFIVKKFRNKIW